MADILTLGGTAWFGRTLAERALAAGHQVTCLARGSQHKPPAAAEFVGADRREPDAYRRVAGRTWDLVVEISWQPGMVERAARALAGRASSWVLISSCSVYAGHDTPGAEESAELLPAVSGETVDVEDYGGAKVACEQITAELTGGRAVLARAGLIGGDGDGSDRTGYWPGRWALAAGGPILLPEDRSRPVQIVDVRDLAEFVLGAGLGGRSGPVNVVGQRTDLADALRLSADAAASAGFEPATPVTASDEWLTRHEVSPWSGPRSLPLWLPGPDHAGFAARSDRRSLDWGLRRRPLADTLRAALVHEQREGLDRARRAGLSRAEELALIDELQDSERGA